MVLARISAQGAFRWIEVPRVWHRLMVPRNFLACDNISGPVMHVAERHSGEKLRFQAGDGPGGRITLLPVSVLVHCRGMSLCFRGG